MPRPAEGPEELSADTVAQLLDAVQRRPHLADVPWRDDEAVFDGTPVLREGAAGQAIAANDAGATSDSVRSRIRDRYISVRFAGVARGVHDLENPTRVIKAAWLAFEERQGDAALELLRLAIAENPFEAPLRIAELDLAWRLRHPDRFVEAARAFHPLWPHSPEWDEIARLGRALAPQEPLFAADGSVARAVDGEAPRWQQSPWGSRPPLEAAEFRRAMLGEQSHGH